MNLPPLILASASPRRSELLQQLSLEFQVVPSDATELHEDYLTPRELAQLNAYRKARAVAKQYPDHLVLGADTIVCLDNQVFGKPQNLAQARRMLEQLQRNTHRVVTGLCLIHLRLHKQRVLAESTEVRFRPLSLEQIDQYLASINPLDKAGGYAIQEGHPPVVEEISGSYSNVVGLPLDRVKAALASWGGQVPL